LLAGGALAIAGYDELSGVERRALGGAIVPRSL
jgi:hypothetical protein